MSVPRGGDRGGRGVPRRRTVELRLVDRARDYAYVARRHVRHAVRRARAGGGSGAQAPLLLLPGVYETWEFLHPVTRALAEAGHPLHQVPGLGYNRRPVDAGAALAARYLEDRDLRGVVVVAHSKGGLIGKQLMLSGAGERVAGMVAIATPFAGSRWARYLVGRTLRSFSPDDPALRALAAERRVDARIVSVYPTFDPHIPETGHLPGARNIELPLAGHFRLLADPTLADVVTREVRRIAVGPAADPEPRREDEPQLGP